MLAAERLSQRYEGWVRDGEAHPSSARMATKARLIRALLRHAAREGVQLHHGTVKHARDLIRYQEKRIAKE